MSDGKRINLAELDGLSEDQIFERLSQAGVAVPEKSPEERIRELERKVAMLSGTRVPASRPIKPEPAPKPVATGSTKIEVKDWLVLAGVLIFVCVILFASNQAHS